MLQDVLQGREAVRGSSRRCFLRGVAAAFAGAVSHRRASFPVTALTGGPPVHFLGSEGVPVCDACGRYVLVHQGPPGGALRRGEPVTVGVVDTVAGNRVIPVGRTTAWSGPLGARAQWLADGPERLLAYNVRREDRWAAVLYDISLHARWHVPFPVYTGSPRGRLVAFVNFSRLAWTAASRGYPGLLDPYRHEPAPEADGLFFGDLRTGRQRLVVPLGSVARYEPKPDFSEAYHWIDRVCFSADGNLCAFLHCWRVPRGAGGARLFAVDVAQGDLRLFAELPRACPILWRGSEAVILHHDRPGGGRAFAAVAYRTGHLQVLPFHSSYGPGTGAFSSDRRFLATDSPPDSYHSETLLVYDWDCGRTTEIGRFPVDRSLGSGLCPAWDPSGRRILITAGAEGRSQVLAVGVGKLF